MVKNILKNSIILLLSLIASWALHYFVISEVLMRFMQSSIILSISIMIITAFILYSSAISLINKKVNKIHIDIIVTLYFLVVICLTFFKSSYSYGYINLNPLSIINDFQNYFNHTLLLTISNTLIYLPLGIYIKNKISVSNKKLIFGYLLYIFLVEIIQSITHKGIFDINDIITNTLGFSIGVLCGSSVIKYFTKHKVNSCC
ncbi:VanZ family protein [Clostridium tagluense]|uniref:VanZ family protein n=1 Tax=Clostridium tagluense TaxID=360422 RepID=UPI001C6E4C7F|nr:VanZ family protein [Clostridium tagluense]MBW9159714.1 VanZ family protein [Clostridium tagluense]WLC63579.1 VanZ family protein [Clostridium tagluense]